MSGNNQSGVAHLLLLVAAAGLVAFLVASQSADFKDQLFSSLFPKERSFASGPVSPSPVATPTPVPDVDFDNDGWLDSKETFIGTDKLDACPDNRKDPAWPPDLNNDQQITPQDNTILANALKTRINKPIVYDKRFDLNTDGQLNSADVSLLNSFIGQRCTNAGS